MTVVNFKTLVFTWMAVIILVGYSAKCCAYPRQGRDGVKISRDAGALLRRLGGTANPCFTFLGLGLATSSLKDMGCMARAAEPMLPGWLVWQSITRKLCSICNFE